jgi:RimJ/RimL family protein N-acetyltransferase
MRIESISDPAGHPVGLPVSSLEPAERPSGATLAGSRVRLERLSAEQHAPDLFQALQANPAGTLWTYMPQGPFDTEGEFTKWVSSIDNSTDPLFYAIIDLSTNRSVGIAAYLRIDTHNRTVEVGWLTFSEQLRRSTAATEAMYLMATHAFELGFRRYEWKCNALNAPSIAAAERLGFSFEGLFRNAVIVKGHNRDTAWFAFTDGDWPAIKLAHEAWLDPSNFDESGNQKKSLRDLTSPLRHSAWSALTVER